MIEDAMRSKVVDTYELEAYLALKDKPKNAIIITCRSFEESASVRKMLDDPDPHIYFAPYQIKHYSQEKAELHRRNIIDMLRKIGYDHRNHYEN